MIIDNLNIARVFSFPPKTQPVLIVDSNTVLPRAITFQRLKAVSRWDAQIAQLTRAMQLRELPQRDTLNLWR